MKRFFRDPDIPRILWVLLGLAVLSLGLAYCFPLRAACTPLPTCTTPVTVSPCASPTPVVSFDRVTDPDVIGYSLYYRLPGGTFQLLVDVVTQEDDAGSQLFPGADWPAPLQRACSSCQPFEEYEFAVKALDSAGLRSVDYSNVLSVCFSPVCVRPGPCN